MGRIEFKCPRCSHNRYEIMVIGEATPQFVGDTLSENKDA